MGKLLAMIMFSVMMVGGFSVAYAQEKLHVFINTDNLVMPKPPDDK